MGNNNKIFSDGFIHFIEKKIPAWQLPAQDFLKSLEKSIRQFLKKEGKTPISILEIRDVNELRRMLERMSTSNRFVYSMRKESKTIQGLRYYIEYVKSYESCSSQDPNNHGIVGDGIAVEDEILIEGGILDCHGSRFERNKMARNRCIAFYGCKCGVCGFDFETVYGEIGRSFIEVHHLIPISKIRESYRIDPIRDLIPLCSNCHSMIHRMQSPMDIMELKRIVGQNNGNLLYQDGNGV